VIQDYLDVFRSGKNGADMKDFLNAWLEDSQASTEMAEETIMVSKQGTPIKPRTVTQKEYIEAIRKNDIVFSIGPAGTGKTFLAMAMALSYLKQDRFDRIVLARPAVEAGETLGFLPGDLQEKVNPYLRPLYDAIYNLMDIETCDQMIEDGTIEIAPLAFMRGRTLSDAFVILDEAQNTTAPQMKMFLTRFGSSSCGVITGDITQIDLPSGKSSGLVEASEILTGIEGISFVNFGQDDVVRHDLVQDIIDAYDDSGTA
ncbi:MAG: PhoH family protein, partial [bacterium]